MLTTILVAWLGVAGPVINDVQAIGLISVFQKWQTLIGVVGAFIVASIAVRPVWRQVELQAAQAGLQLLPQLEKDLKDFDGDLNILTYVSNLEEPLVVLSLVESAAHKDPEKGFPILFTEAASFAISIIKGIDEIPESHWMSFKDRVGLSEYERDLRSKYYQEVRNLKMICVMMVAHLTPDDLPQAQRFATPVTLRSELPQDIHERVSEFIHDAVMLTSRADYAVRESIRASTATLRDLSASIKRSIQTFR